MTGTLACQIDVGLVKQVILDRITFLNKTSLLYHSIRLGLKKILSKHTINSLPSEKIRTGQRHSSLRQVLPLWTSICFAHLRELRRMSSCIKSRNLLQLVSCYTVADYLNRTHVSKLRDIQNIKLFTNCIDMVT